MQQINLLKSSWIGKQNSFFGKNVKMLHTNAKRENWFLVSVHTAENAEILSLLQFSHCCRFKSRSKLHNQLREVFFFVGVSTEFHDFSEVKLKNNKQNFDHKWWLLTALMCARRWKKAKSGANRLSNVWTFNRFVKTKQAESWNRADVEQIGEIITLRALLLLSAWLKH